MPHIQSVLAAAFDATFDCIIIADQQGTIIDINNAAERAFGLAKTTARGASIGGLLVPPHLIPLYESEWQAFWSGGQTAVVGQQQKTTIQHADGREVPVVSAMSRIEIDGDDFAVISLRDLSDVEELESDRRRTSHMLEAFLRHAPVGIYLKDREGRYTLANPQMGEVFDQPADSLIGRSARDLLPSDIADMIDDLDAQVIAAGKPVSVVEKLDDTDAFEWSLVVRFPVEDEAGEMVVAGFDIDITAQKRAEEQARQAQERLAHAERMTALGSLLAGVSHELNNPLAIVVGETTLLAEDLQGTEHEKSAIRIERAAERCARIVQSFLAMARQKPSARVPVDLNKAIEGAIELTGYQTRTSDISVDIDLDTDLPLIEADPDQVQQILLNLLVNAQQALLERDQGRTIIVQSAIEEGDVIVRVRDNGPGIDPKLRSRIFDPYFTTKPEGAGTGIGLAFSQGAAEGLGGSLSLEPSEGGASFLLRFPARTVDGPHKTSPFKTSSDPAQQKTALVVDDEPELADALARLLERQGYQCITASDGREAQAKLEQESFDLVLSDLRMPGMDGHALLNWTKDNRPDQAERFAFITGDTLSPDALRTLEQAQCPVAAKPITRDTLRALLAEIEK